ncbi:unnamed protein product [Sphagnum jensenii]|uniref:Uncharacterized protein n=1 Tax=Sphagnum jensenii TaxID=128206 RepID=A0ABP0VWF3_9BRYO
MTVAMMVATSCCSSRGVQQQTMLLHTPYYYVWYCSRIHAFKLLQEMEMRVLSSSETDLGGVQYADLKKATQTQVHIHSRVQICCALSST